MLDRDQLVLNYLPLVRSIGRQLVRHLPTSVELDDLLGWGALALVECSRVWDPQRSSFAAFARPRIRWVMLDSIRGSRHHPVDPILNGVPIPPDFPAPEPEPPPEKPANMAALEVAYLELTRDEQRLVDEVYTHGKSLRRVARSGGLRRSEATIRRMHGRALQKMRESISRADLPKAA